MITVQRDDGWRVTCYSLSDGGYTMGLYHGRREHAVIAAGGKTVLEAASSLEAEIEKLKAKVRDALPVFTEGYCREVLP